MSIEQNIHQIQVLRETKGKEDEVETLINQTMADAINSSDYRSQVILNWESHLNWQHRLMNNRDSGSPNPDLHQDYAQKMLDTAKTAAQIASEHQLEDLLANSHRFLGRAYTELGMLREAEAEYRRGFEMLKLSSHPGHLEIEGFLAQNLIQQGKVKEGLNLAREAFMAFENLDVGQELRGRDYFTWGVWVSGIFTRLVKDLLKSGQPFDKNEIRSYLDKSLTYLNSPPPTANLQPGAFSYRLDEVNQAISDLG